MKRLKKIKPKDKFKQGVRAVEGSPGLWDINYQVKKKRVTKRIEAVDYDAALTIRLAMKTTLRKKKEGVDNGEPVFSLDEALEKITEKIENEIIRGKRCNTALSEVVPPYRRFFFDYPKYLGISWGTTADITPKDLEGYKDYYSDVLKKPNGLSTEINKIQSILTHLYQLGFISSLKLFEFRQVKRPRKNSRPFIGNSASDFIKVLLWIKDKKPRLFEFLSFVTNTARRPKEVRRYLREYVNLEQDYIYVQAEITKNKRPSEIILDEELKRDVVKAVNFSKKLNSKYLFLNDNGRPFSANNPQLNFKKAAKECGIPNWEKWSVYQLKKRFITITRAEKHSGESISMVSGHANLDSVMGSYSFPDREQAEKVLKTGRLRV